MAQYNSFPVPSRRPEQQPQPQQSTIQTLEEVVIAGDHRSAVQQAAELAQRASSAPAAPVGATTRIKVRIVDMLEAGASLNIDVRPAYSVLDLKVLMCMEHKMPPPHEQIWIINGRVRDDDAVVGHIVADLTHLSMCLYLKRPDHSVTPSVTPDPFELWWSREHGNEVDTAGAQKKDTFNMVNGHVIRRRQRDVIHIAGVPEPVRLTDNRYDPGAPYGAAAAAAAAPRLRFS